MFAVLAGADHLVGDVEQTPDDRAAVVTEIAATGDPGRRGARRGPEPAARAGAWPWDDGLLARAESMAARARDGELALFFGAGVSIPAGLPSWPELLRACLEACPELSDDSFAGLHPLDQGELLRRRLGDRFGRIVAEHPTASQHALGHALLAELGCTQTATTNYDRCFELAAGAADAPPVVMPWQRPSGGRPWLLKLNGDVLQHRGHRPGQRLVVSAGRAGRAGRSKPCAAATAVTVARSAPSPIRLIGRRWPTRPARCYGSTTASTPVPPTLNDSGPRS